MLRQSYKNTHTHTHTHIYIYIYKKTKILAEGPNLEYPIWFSCLNWAVKTVMPFLEGDQIVILQALVGLRKAGYQSNNIGLRLEVISRPGKGMAFLHVNDIMPCKP